jgi:glutamate synthase domain-containing protein 3
MKAYQDKIPILVIGGTAGSFLGEYQAGGLIIVLGSMKRRGAGRQLLGSRHARRENFPAV